MCVWVRAALPPWLPRAAALVLLFAIVGGAAHWTQMWLAAPSRAVPTPISIDTNAGDAKDATSVLGVGRAGASPTRGAYHAVVGPPAAGLRLTGLVADRQGRGYALISVHGGPAKLYVVGSRVDEVLALHSVSPRHAVLVASVGAPILLALEQPEIEVAAGTQTVRWESPPSEEEAPAMEDSVPQSVSRGLPRLAEP